MAEDFSDVTGGSSSAGIGTLPLTMPTDPAQIEAAFFNAWKQLNRVAVELGKAGDPRAAAAKAKADAAYAKWRTVGDIRDKADILRGLLYDITTYPADVVQRAAAFGNLVAANIVPVAVMLALLWWLMGQRGPRRDW